MRLKNRMHLMMTYAYSAAIQMVYGVDKNKVLFSSFGGGKYADNPRAISEALHAISPDTDIVWVVDKRSDSLPNYIRTVSMDNTLQYGKELATAGAIVTNLSLPRIHKNKQQLFIQTWHGDRAFKKIQYDNPHLPKDYYVAESKDGYCDLCVAGSKYGEKKYRSAFRYSGKISMVGTPRDDRLVNLDPSEIATIKKKLGIPDDTRILLYAPTIRKKHKDSQLVKDIDINLTLSALEEKFHCHWVCFMRAHPAVAELSGIQYNEKIHNLSDYEDMADLLLVSDMLITDYSSCAGDFALLNRPLILFQADRQEYMAEERTFYFNIYESPYYIAESQGELENIIASLDDEKVRKNCKDILEFYGSCETGRASEYLAKMICERAQN